MQEFESPGDRAGRGVICLCLRHIVPCQTVSSSEVLWLFFLFFFQVSFVQFSAVHCAVHMQSTHDPDNDLSTMAPKKKASIITLCRHATFPSPPELR